MLGPWFVFILVLHQCFTAVADSVEMIAPVVVQPIATEPPKPGVCSEACYQVATCNEEVGGRCDCPKHLAGRDCVRQATPSRLAAYAHSYQAEAKAPMHCLNRCNGRGRCAFGTCICSRGNFSSDCSISLDAEDRPVVLAGTGYQPRRRRPWIYVYDVPHKYSSWHNPGRMDRSLHFVFWERLLGSGTLVSDGEVADWYYIPVKLRSTSDGYRLLEAMHYIRKTWPWYDRLQGHRHFVIHTGDTGRGEVPEEVRDYTANVTWLHHWGLYEDWMTSGWRAAHRIGKDVVVPVYFGARQGTSLTTMSGLHPRAPRLRRTRTLLFAGRICGDYSNPIPGKPWPHCETDKSPGYSQGVRQLVHFHHHNRSGYKIVTSNGRYPLDLLSFKWCLAPSGGGHGHRQVLVAIMGCLPLIISDAVMQPFEPEMDWDSFGLRVPIADIPRLHEQLEAVGEEELERKRLALRCAVQHMVFSTIGGALFQEDGRWDAFEFILEILRMQQQYPGLDPRKYPETDARYRAFLYCGDDEGMESYGRKLLAAQDARYPPSEKVPLPAPPARPAAAAAGAAASPPRAEPSWSSINMEQFNLMLHSLTMRRDPALRNASLPLCSSSVWDWGKVRCRISQNAMVMLAPGGAACEEFEDRLADCPRTWP